MKKAAYQEWLAKNDAPPGDDGIQVTDMGVMRTQEWKRTLDDGPDPQEIAMQRQELRMLLEQIERLPIRLREALILVSIDGRSQAEAAELLGVSEKAIETRIYRARQKLRDRLENF